MKECPVCRSCFSDAVDNCDKDNQPTRITLRIDDLISDKYQLVRRLGNGSVSVVYLATDLHSGVNHAVKIILPEFINEDRKVAERFLAEATAPLTLQHPNIVRVTDSGLLTGLLPFLVMDFITGPSLHETLSNSGPLEPLLALEYISTIGMALGAAHERKIVHGDLKPRSILMEQDRPLAEAIKISDFGHSTIKSGKLQGSMAAKSSGVLRSPLYLAPEEFSEEASDFRSDIYSLGIILYEMLSGKVPFSGKSIPGIMKRHLLDAPPPIAGRSPGITLEIERVVMHALEKDPARRPRSMEHFVEEFASAVRGKEIFAGKINEKVVEQVSVAGLEDTVLVSQLEEAYSLTDYNTETSEKTGIDLDQTIVLTKAGRASVNTQEVKDETYWVSDMVVGKGELPEAAEADFDATILPGMMKLGDGERGPLSPVANDPVLETWTQEVDEQAFSDDATELSGEGPVRRSAALIFLAVGVFMFVLLIALGVYYSRTTQ